MYNWNIIDQQLVPQQRQRASREHTHRPSLRRHPTPALGALDFIRAGWLDLLTIAFTSVFHVNVQRVANVIVRDIAGRDSSLLIAATRQDVVEMAHEEVTGAQIEGKLLPWLHEVDPEGIFVEELAWTAGFVGPDLILIQGRMDLRDVFPGLDTKKLLEVNAHDVLQRQLNSGAEVNSVGMRT